MFKRVTVLAVLAFFAVIGTAQAQQQGTIEIGVDNAFSMNLAQELKVNDVVVDSSRTDFNFLLPSIAWRFGFFVSPQFSIEPQVGFILEGTGNDGGTDYAFQGGVNVNYNLPSGLFAGVNGAILYASDDPGGGADKFTATQFGFGGQVGYRTPFIADNIRFRVALMYDYLLKSENLDDPNKATLPNTHRFMVPFGISVMTK